MSNPGPAEVLPPPQPKVIDAVPKPGGPLAVVPDDPQATLSKIAEGGLFGNKGGEEGPKLDQPDLKLIPGGVPEDRMIPKAEVIIENMLGVPVTAETLPANLKAQYDKLIEGAVEMDGATYHQEFNALISGIQASPELHLNDLQQQRLKQVSDFVKDAPPEAVLNAVKGTINSALLDIPKAEKVEVTSAIDELMTEASKPPEEQKMGKEKVLKHVKSIVKPFGSKPALMVLAGLGALLGLGIFKGIKLAKADMGGGGGGGREGH